MTDDTVVLFLLNHPPLDEIGGSITDTIELYRNKCITKRQAIALIKEKYQPYINKYAEQAAVINSNIF
jgi:hypothetical protein